MSGTAEAIQRWGPTRASLPHGLASLLAQELPAPTPRPALDLADVHVRGSRLGPDQLSGLPGRVLTQDLTRLRASGGFSLADLCVRRWATDEVPAVDAVVVPSSHDEVRAVIHHCQTNRLGLVPFGGGTSVVSGIAVGDRPTLAMAFWDMSDPLELDSESGEVLVQPGITGPALERWLAARGFTWGHVPQSWERATVGGYVATRSAGQASTGYGRSDDTVTKLRVATPAGDFRLGRGPASAAGPDLRQVFLGSEGAFGIITEIGLRVRPLPETSHHIGLLFPSFDAGTQAFRRLSQDRAPADVMRLSDRAETAASMAISGPEGWKAQAFERYARARHVDQGCLAILGWEGPADVVAARRTHAKKVARRLGAVSLGSSVGRSWLKGRFRGAYLRDDLLDAGYLVETLETANEWSRLSGTCDAVRQALTDELGHVLIGTHLSHIYPTGASLYFTVIATAADDPIAQWRAARARACDALITTGATITHHHAVGRDHAPWLSAEIGQTGIELLRAVKTHLDPVGILNPGVLGLG